MSSALPGTLSVTGVSSLVGCLVSVSFSCLHGLCFPRVFFHWLLVTLTGPNNQWEAVHPVGAGWAPLAGCGLPCGDRVASQLSGGGSQCLFPEVCCSILLSCSGFVGQNPFCSCLLAGEGSGRGGLVVGMGWERGTRASIRSHADFPLAPYF